MNSITPFLAYYQVPPYTLPPSREEWERRLKAFLEAKKAVGRGAL